MKVKPLRLVGVSIIFFLTWRFALVWNQERSSHPAETMVIEIIVVVAALIWALMLRRKKKRTP